MKHTLQGRTGVILQYRPRAAWLLGLYLVGLAATGVHLAAADHHLALLHPAPHACPDDHQAHQHLVATSTPDSDCCHQLHDALPGKTTHGAIKALKNAASRRAPALLPGVVTLPTTRPSVRPIDATTTRVATGATSVASGRAPPPVRHA